jgi:hypothetical protein
MPGQIVQQRRLAHARLTGHDQRPALTGANSIDQPVQHVALAASARQPCRASSDGECLAICPAPMLLARRPAAGTSHWRTGRGGRWGGSAVMFVRFMPSSGSDATCSAVP